ncbi:MAG: hypothetical protein JRM80_03605 [Nitrososphaerota archaeon]|nr:hypothetical protein [Nitrososphaerota archaeon]
MSGEAHREVISMVLPPEVSLYYPEVLRVIKELDKVSWPKEQTRIDLLLNSWGGDAHSAFKMVLLLRSHCNTLNIVVPLMAKSAATLMCLGADRIYMNGKSELGPLDAQLEHPHVQGFWISSRDEVDALSYLEYVAEMWAEDLAVKAIAPEITRNLGLKARDSLELAFKYTAEVLKPVVEQIDPLIVNMSFRELEMTEKYARELLTRFMLRGDADAEKLAASIANELVNEYYEHGYVIDINEARRLKLKVAEFSNLENHEKFWQHYINLEEKHEPEIKLITEEILGTDASEHAGGEVNGQSSKS